ncbi:MAG: lactonase family protein [Acidobacteriia bacterium]|nr:lactonase family protein [Terriglobia bacterium]
MTISRRWCLQWLLLLSLVTLTVAKHDPKSKYLLFVGTYTEKGSKGIYGYRFDTASSELTELGVAAETTNPSFLAVDPSRHLLYAVNEVQKYRDASSGAVSAFAIDRQTGKLSLLNQVASRGADPCYIAFDKTGKYALVANYTGGNVAIFPIDAKGRLGEPSAVLKNSGALGPNKERQDAPHSHWIEASAHNHFVYVSDLGLDRVLIYRFDATKGTLTNGAPPSSAAKSGSPIDSDFFSATLAPGTGPRHVAFSDNGNFMYVLGELDSTVTVFANDDKETFRSIQRISALPSGFSGQNDAAEIAIHPNGKYLYTSNRGHDSIALFSIDSHTGALTLVDHFPTQGKTPRNFEIDPTGKFLFVANQDSNNIVVFRIDSSSGRLTPTGQTVHVPSPVCLKFMAVD